MNMHSKAVILKHKVEEHLEILEEEKVTCQKICLISMWTSLGSQILKNWAHKAIYSVLYL